MDEAAERRRARRRGWSVQRFSVADASATAQADAAFWDAVPVSERAALTWQLSVELFELATGHDVQRRLPRSAYRPVRR